MSFSALFRLKAIWSPICTGIFPCSDNVLNQLICSAGCFAMHLFFNHGPPKAVHAYMGHERYESTEVYLKVFALDVAPQLDVTFSLDHRDYSHLLTRK